jgi:molybdenum-dependent DNA-binding transcriptional regulator ModE
MAFFMNLHRIDLVSLSLFNLVARTGSISQGAELAMLAVGAASKRVADLEARLGAAKAPAAKAAKPAGKTPARKTARKA